MQCTPAQFATCRQAAGLQQQQPAGAAERRRPLGRGCSGGCGGPWLPRCHPGDARCAALASRVNRGYRRWCGQGGRHRHAPPCLTPCCAFVSSLFPVAGGGFASSVTLWGQDAPAAHAAGAGCARRCRYTSKVLIVVAYIYCTVILHLLYAGAGCVGVGKRAQQCSLWNFYIH